MSPCFVNRLRRDTRGVTVIEFAFIAPVFLLLLMGFFHLGQMVYGQAILNGALQDAARSSTLEGADTSAADLMVTSQVSKVLPGAQVTSSRISYFDHADIGRPEKWNDDNDNGTCDDGESYTDENGSGSWDADIGEVGNGGAGDVIVYTVELEYEPLFPLALGSPEPDRVHLQSSTVRKNQPFSEQTGYGTGASTCV